MKREKYEAIFNKVRELELALNGNGGGNPNHDPSNGQFTSGPGGKSEKSSGYKPKISEDAQDVFDEEDELTDGAYKKDLDSIFKEFSDLGVDMGKVQFETNLDKLPSGMKNWINKDKNIKGCAFSKKNLEALIYLDEDLQMDYTPVDERKKYIEGKDIKDQPFTVNGTAMGAIRHELGHIASYTLFMKSSGRKASDDNINVGAARLDIHNRFKKIFGNNYELSKLKLSRYGTKDSGEAVAESFSNPDFSEDTRKIYDYYKKELSKIKNKNAAEKSSEWVILCDGYPAEGIDESKKIGE